MKKLLAAVLSASFVMVMGISLVGCSPATPAKKDAPKTEPAKDAKTEPAKDAKK